MAGRRAGQGRPGTAGLMPLLCLATSTPAGEEGPGSGRLSGEQQPAVSNGEATYSLSGSSWLGLAPFPFWVLIRARHARMESSL
jgi:hypothetical protein